MLLTDTLIRLISLYRIKDLEKINGGEAGIRTLGAQKTLLISSQARSTAPAPLLSKRLSYSSPRMLKSLPTHGPWFE